MLYSVSLILIARQEHYEAGLDVLGTVVDSFQVL
jgi:hypothetical protein